MPTPSPPPHRHKHNSLLGHFQHTLPPYTGPYPVGFLELELPARDPRPFSPHIKRDGEYALKLDTVLCAVYYPAENDDDYQQQPGTSATSALAAAAPAAPPTELEPEPANQPQGQQQQQNQKTPDKRRQKQKPKKNHKPSSVPWLPRPRTSTCKGYAKFFHVPRVPMTAYMAATSMFTKLPAYRNARFAQRWPPDISARAGAGAARDDHKPRFPVVLFSHGLGGSRTLYSTVCGELASFGLVVVAVEHRDGSGARTFVNKAGKAEDLESQGFAKTAGPPDNEKDASRRRRRRRRRQREGGEGEVKPNYKIDYLFPKDNAKDTSPQNPNGVDQELRAAQIEMRLAEIEEAYYVLGLINGGQGAKVREDNLRKGDNIGSSSVGLEGIDWQDWASRLDLESVTMMGHSFGGATTVQALRSERLPWITQGILLDPWGPATPDCTEQESVHKPVLSIGSEAFMHWAENFDCIEQLCREARASGTLSWMTTIRGSTHLSQTDFAVLYPNWMSLLIKTVVDSDRAIYLTVHSALEFLKLTLPRAQTRLAAAWADEQLLSCAGSETKVVSDHRPDDKWVAARLKIPNEFSTRLRSTLRWNTSSKYTAGQGRETEIWCHQSPDRHSVERYMRRNGRLPVSTIPEGAIALAGS